MRCRRKTNQYGFTCMWNLNKKTEQSIEQTIITTTKESEKQAHKYRDQTGGCQRQGCGGG